ncbi:MAG: addiction module protein [Promethearchaeota archaeon]
MTSKFNELGKKALELSTHDRALLIRKLLESLEDGEEVENAEEIWTNEVKRRYNEYKQEKTSGNPAKQVLEDAKVNLK